MIWHLTPWIWLTWSDAFEARCDKEIDIRDVKNMVQVKDVVRYIIDHGLMEAKD